MCLILVAWRQHEHFPLVVAANRDEFFARPTAGLAAWPDCPNVIGGRDLEGGGTWLGATAAGRFAAVTNVREAARIVGKRSRGELAADYLHGELSPGAYMSRVSGDDYAGFNLILADRNELWYGSNRGIAPVRLAPGIYGVSNHLLDTPWPKLTTSKTRFTEALGMLPAEGGFFSLLADSEIVPDANLPVTGVPLAWERLLSAVFVCSPDYGTRASTLYARNADGGTRLVERSFGPQGVLLGESLLDLPSPKSSDR